MYTPPIGRTPGRLCWQHLDSTTRAKTSLPLHPSCVQFEHTERWQPLMESNGFGYITTPEHVTPHIGVTARFFGFETAEDEEAYASRELSTPPYRERYRKLIAASIDLNSACASCDVL